MKLTFKRMALLAVGGIFLWTICAAVLVKSFQHSEFYTSLIRFLNK